MSGGEAVCERYRDAWGAKPALALALLATLACIALASPWLVVAHEVESVIGLQLATILLISLLGSFARRRRVSLVTILGDAIVLWSCLAATAIAVVYAIRHYDVQVQVATFVVAPLVGGAIIKLRVRGRAATPGPVLIVTFFLVKGVVIALPLTPAIIGLKLALRKSLLASPLFGAAFAVGAGFCLAVPIALALLAHWPAGRSEARDWEHLRRA